MLPVTGRSLPVCLICSRSRYLGRLYMFRLTERRYWLPQHQHVCEYGIDYAKVDGAIESCIA